MSNSFNVSIRPNLNSKGQVTIHNGKLGLKWFSISQVTINCTSTTVRRSGQKKAEEEGIKTVHASLNGELHHIVLPSSSSLPLTYNPHRGDDAFYIINNDGTKERYTGGGLVTMIGWKAWLIYPD